MAKRFFRQGNVFFVIFSVLFSFITTVGVSQPANDNFASAISVTGIINSCSADAAYTTVSGTGDLNDGSCWNTAGGVAIANVWFSFVAPASGEINVTVDIGGAKGTQQRTQLALWQSDGTTEVSCNRYITNTDDVVVGSTALTPGLTYYISVDVQNTGYNGTFTLCLSDAVDYDYYEGAIDVTGLINACSTDAAYTTIGGSGDLNDGSCWNTSGGVALYNRWFSFTAPASGQINITVDVGGAKGTQLRTQVAIWESDGITEVSCNRYTTNGDDVVVGATGITPGNTYYISVDTQNAGYYGSFTLCLADVLDYDYYEGAIDVTGLINSCSTDAEYTTIGGTSDLNDASCWNTSGGVTLYNRWFSFTAPASGEINITVDIGGAKGTQLRTQVAIWESDGTTEVSCNRYTSNGDDVVVGATGLTPGNTYYISVDTQNAGYYGSFTLCLADALDYDYYEGAIDVTGLINSCSTDAEYTTIGGTSDLNDASCWNTSGGVTLYNRWFSFTAPASGEINITVDVGGVKGTQLRTQVAIWESDGITEVSCNRYVSNGDDVVVGANSLTPGNTYYISVDTQNAGYYGSFTLCLADALDYDYYEGAIDVTGLINSCSTDAEYTTIGGTSDLNDASCWNTSGGVTLHNRWFFFTAPASGEISITVDVGGAKGSQLRTQIAIWESDGTTEVSCNRYTSNGDDVVVGATSLTPGNTYYISVDTQNSGYYGSFTLCLADALDYDFYEGAVDVTGLINSCSTDAEYTTIGATSDLNDASCWNTNGGVTLYNRWFSFTAPASGEINVTIDIGGAKGTQLRTQVAIWESDGTTEVSCNRYVLNGDDVVVGATGITPGNTYYISVDTQNGGYYGSFTLCLADALDYDYYEGAIDVTGLIDSCSTDAEYTTIGGTSDLNPGSCWNTNGGIARFNRWFMFTAPPTGLINVTVDIGGSKGSQSRSQVAIWESDGITEVSCNRYVNNGDDVVVGSTTLTPGNTYYISVDAQNVGYYGSFTLCLSSVVDYDYYEGAYELTDVSAWCSTDAEFTTIGGTSDLNGGSCWNTSGGNAQYNRWFKFKATTNSINVTVDVGGAMGNQGRTQIALWASDGVTELSCNRYVNNGDDVVLNAVGLTINQWYYVSVDAQASGYRGSFSLCVDNQPDYDYYEGAYELTDLNNWCSSDAQFSTIGGTSDKNIGSCWNTGGSPLYNRWFKFTAIHTDATITVDRGGAMGTQQRTQLALWESDGLTEVDCQRYVANTDDVTINATGLTIGNDYYISVDAQSSGYRGSFSLCVSNIKDNYYSINSGNWNILTNWSTVSHVGPVAAVLPDAGDVINIEGHTITVTDTRACADINISVATAVTSLDIDGGSLTANGPVTMINVGNNFDGTLILQNGATFSVNDDFSMTKTTGANAFDLSITGSGSALTINKDFLMDIDGGTVTSNLLTISDNGTLTAGEDLTLDNSGGQKILAQLSNTAAISAGRDLNLLATADDLVELELNNSSTATVGRDIGRAGSYGIFDSNNSSTLVLNGATSVQSLPDTLGSGTGDKFSYNNITVNNSDASIPQIQLEGHAQVNGVLTLIDGLFGTSSSATLYFPSSGSMTGGSNASYISGPAAYYVDVATSEVKQFHIGKAFYGRVDLTIDQTVTTNTIYTAEVFDGPASVLGLSIPAGIEKISGVRYYQVTQSAPTAIDDAKLRIHYVPFDGVNDPPNLTILNDDGVGNWVDLTGVAAGSPAGSILSGSFTEFTYFTLANLNGGTNPLPVHLMEFKSEVQVETISISWSTYSENDNHFFTLEKSSDGLEFEEIGRFDSQSSGEELTNYSFIDNNPYLGLNYYRLSQTDLDGTSSELGIVRSIFESKLGYSVYPNPISSGRELNMSSQLFSQGKANLTITDMFGKVLYQSEIRMDGRSRISTTLPAYLASGMYLVRLNINSAVLTSQLLIR